VRFDIDKKTIYILGVPDHKNYITYMMDKASQVSIAALIISAKTGKFESGEHIIFNIHLIGYDKRGKLVRKKI
jgi:translation elongation factor EF-1alpha